MKYVVKSSNDKLKLASHNINLVGLKVTPKKGENDFQARLKSEKSKLLTLFI